MTVISQLSNLFKEILKMISTSRVKMANYGTHDVMINQQSDLLSHNIFIQGELNMSFLLIVPSKYRGKQEKTLQVPAVWLFRYRYAYCF